ncbi:sulfonate/nitrate transporter [Alkalilimnicola ehrlichii]|uniref:Sulfonate/nitrate transporter n=1 Tax=Alkalilimnicola ehrlichii TaxID=351052 RepID=A0A3E0WZJ9_9GAMM|nr:ABC transporter substrate-binding protein [Alkalilimnicola ehrlichii]RFA28421.1 sulfonate/nitrate transporter [Alkalilimnicola ehrlichii]RFA38511.1 sulfonate/nitrate transporter [Alkalilimnicola ehrlichii]
MALRLFKHSLFALGLLAASTTAAFAADKIRWMNDWLPSGDKAAIYLGVEQGFFAEEGIEVEIINGRGSSEVVTRLAAGAADMGTGGLPALLQAKAEQTINVSAVMSIYSMQPDLLILPEGSPIRSLADVEGKTLGTATFSASNVIWPILLRSNDIDPDSVNLVRMDPGALGPMLAAGRVDGTINWITKIPSFAEVMQEAGKDVEVILWSDYGLDGYGLSVLASDRLIQRNPDLVERATRAYSRALALAVENPRLAAEALKAHVPEMDVELAAAEFEASIPLIVNDISDANGIGTFEPELLAKTWEWVARSQELALDALDPTSAIDTRFIAD